MDDVVRFAPRRWRALASDLFSWSLVVIAFLAAGYLTGRLPDWRLVSVAWLGGVVGATVAIVTGVFDETIEVTAEHVRGPGSWWRRGTIPLVELDVDALKRRRLRDVISSSRVLRSQRLGKVVISSSYSRAEKQRVIDTVLRHRELLGSRRTSASS
ncbi:MAG: hypothetical protein KGZ40_07125 [Clostridiales bacterium]|nr:hypothetical protein [Clostridiales bacterium]